MVGLRQTLDGERRVAVIASQLAQDLGGRGRDVVPAELGWLVERRDELGDAAQPGAVELDIERGDVAVALLFVALAWRVKHQHARAAAAAPPTVALEVRPAEVQTEVGAVVRVPR